MNTIFVSIIVCLIFSGNAFADKAKSPVSHETLLDAEQTKEVQDLLLRDISMLGLKICSPETVNMDLKEGALKSENYESLVQSHKLRASVIKLENQKYEDIIAFQLVKVNKSNSVQQITTLAFPMTEDLSEIANPFDIIVSVVNLIPISQAQQDEMKKKGMENPPQFYPAAVLRMPCFQVSGNDI